MKTYREFVTEWDINARISQATNQYIQQNAIKVPRGVPNEFLKKAAIENGKTAAQQSMDNAHNKNQPVGNQKLLGKDTK